MSEDVRESYVVLELPELSGFNYNGALEFFEKMLGAPDDQDAYGNGYFSYTGPTCEFEDEALWGIRRMIQPQCASYDAEDLVLEIDEISDIRSELVCIAGNAGLKTGRCWVVSQGWYNGSDRPGLGL